MGNKKDVLISIVNGSNRGYIHECVSSIYAKTTGITYDVVVIDNCTGEEGLSRLEERGVKLLLNSEPMGFSRNHAQILPMIDDYRHVVLFNDDAFLINNVFKLMVQEADSDLNVAIAGCHITDPDGELQPTAARFPTIRYFVSNMLGTDQQSGYRYSDFFRCYIDFSESQYVDWVSGCCMLLPTDFIKKYGFLDVEYFMFLEDADICRRAHRVGKKVKYIAEAEVVHHRGGSSKGDGGKMKPFLFLETQRSRLRFLRKESFFQYLLYFMFIYPFIGLKLMRSYWRGDIGWSNEVLGRLVKMPLH